MGLAAAEAHLAARFNKPDAKLVDQYTYCILGDGCNMEVKGPGRRGAGGGGVNDGGAWKWIYAILFS